MNNFTRNCPECTKIINYNAKWSCEKAQLANRLCKSCSKKGNKNPQYGNSGDKNPFYNKKHSKETKEKISLKNKGHKHSDEYKKNHKKIFTGKKKSIDKNSHLKVWINKYGIERAKEMYKDYKKLLSNKYSGEGNPMYGKPSPQGSGNGWSGWYKGWFFRSLLELSYMISVIERFNISWESCENNLYQIKYLDWNNKQRNYYPDFILANKYLIEIKPKRLQNSVNVKLKQQAAIEFCNKHNLKYKLTAGPNNLNLEILKHKIQKGELIFTKRYQVKFENYKKI